MTKEALTALFCSNQAIGRIARAVRALTPHGALESLAGHAQISLSEASEALTSLEQFALVTKDRSTSTYSISALSSDTLGAIEHAIQEMETAHVRQRAKEWKLDAQGRLEWIEGLYQMIQSGKKSRAHL